MSPELSVLATALLLETISDDECLCEDLEGQTCRTCRVSNLLALVQQFHPEIFRLAQERRSNAAFFAVLNSHHA